MIGRGPLVGIRVSLGIESTLTLLLAPQVTRGSQKPQMPQIIVKKPLKRVADQFQNLLEERGMKSDRFVNVKGNLKRVPLR